MRVVLADREGIARRMLAKTLREHPAVTRVSEVSTRPQLAHALRSERPDVVLIDDRLIEGERHLLAGLGPMKAVPRVIVIGVDDDPAFSARAHRLGAEAWVAKDRADEDLLGLLAPR